MKLTSNINYLFAGGLSHLQPEGQRTGIFKQRIHGRARIDVSGIVGDEHGDPRIHGGPEKAVHHYAAENYTRLAQSFPSCQHALVPGSLGENVSTLHLNERNVHLGDFFRVGKVLLQVSQPRNPCWKINHRFDTERMSVHIAHERITGWYYRVIESGFIEPGDEIMLVERQTDEFSIDQFWQVQGTHRPYIDDLLKIIDIPGLAEDWKLRLGARVKWLQKLVHSDV